MKRRRYQSPVRDAAARRTRDRIVAAAATVLGKAKGLDDFSLEAVAKKAGVTRLTVYNQFGTRWGLLEAVFDACAVRGGLHRLADVMTQPDPRAAIASVIETFCDFWSFDPPMFRLLHGAAGGDRELEVSLRERNELRRGLFTVLVRRLPERQAIEPQAAGDLVDVLFALTGFHFFAELTRDGRTSGAACLLIQGLAAAAVQRAVKT